MTLDEGSISSSFGSIRFETPERDRIAAAIAGALAEQSVQQLSIADPRTCRALEVMARECDLPGVMLELPPGTTLKGEGVALLVDERDIRWVAEERIAGALRAIE